MLPAQQRLSQHPFYLVSVAYAPWASALLTVTGSAAAAVQCQECGCVLRAVGLHVAGTVDQCCGTCV